MLGVQAGVIALTKSDLVDPDLLELVRLEGEEFVAGSFLADAPKVAVSSTTRLREFRNSAKNSNAPRAGFSLKKPLVGSGFRLTGLSHDEGVRHRCHRREP